MENVMNACLKIYDALKDDDASKNLIELIDSAESDTQLMKGIRDGVSRLEELGNTSLANEIKQSVRL